MTTTCLAHLVFQPQCHAHEPCSRASSSIAWTPNYRGVCCRDDPTHSHPRHLGHLSQACLRRGQHTVRQYPSTTHARSAPFAWQSSHAPTMLFVTGRECPRSGIPPVGSSVCPHAVCSPDTTARHRRTRRLQGYKYRGQLPPRSLRVSLRGFRVCRRREVPIVAYLCSKQLEPAGLILMQLRVVGCTHNGCNRVHPCGWLLC